MRITARMLVAASVTLATSLGAQTATETLENAARAMGGKDRVLAVRTVAMDFTGDNYNLGQNLTADAPLPRYEITQGRRVLDFANKRWFVDQTRVPRFVTGNTAPQRQRLGVDADVAYNVAADGAVQRAGAQVAADRAAELFDHPVGLLQAAFAAGDVALDRDWIRFTSGGRKVAMLVDRATSLPLRIRRTIDSPVLGDALVETELSEWRDDAASGTKQPGHIVNKVGRWVVYDVRASNVTVNGEIGDITATSEVRQQAAPVAPITVTVDDVAPGVWLLAGQSHHTVAIETSKNIVLVEAPQNDARTLAVIEKARTLVPGKPVDLVINTHHHFDHSGGVRAAVSQGLTVATHQSNRDFYERTMYPARHTMVPDALTQNPRALRLMTIGDRLVMRDSLRTIELYHVDGSEHAGSMLMVYLPAERLLIEADLYSPPAANAATIGPFPFAANLLENVQRRRLNVERIIPIHGRVVPFSELQSAATRTQ